VIGITEVRRWLLGLRKDSVFDADVVKEGIFDFGTVPRAVADGAFPVVLLAPPCAGPCGGEDVPCPNIIVERITRCWME